MLDKNMDGGACAVMKMVAEDRDKCMNLPQGRELNGEKMYVDYI